ncbi:PTI1-like tyrosine-protein kinase [Acorus gramineus]|uniref:non-specific serine/threonine protein kinase n=1 Tax=Acorus gramineus TaxID=55184 RepID=A0AAV9ADG5_ACOGR|nr:PTI1-like tyrosine-protein kinase [Acorus gramineus]
MNCVNFSICFFVRRSKKRQCYPWEIFTLRELQHATNNFHNDNKLGEGGFGSVYWGRTTQGTEIAVKRLKAITLKAEIEFAVEVEILGRVRHKNLLGLRGYYAGGDERLIVYDNMPNHSLIAHLHGHLADDVLLDWHRRMNIIIGTAEGIAHLHHESNPHIIHRDIKASNILLDSDFNAKVADFGFAKLIPEGGYLAPEYAMWGKVSESCDVFSFGILVFEIISARKPIEKLWATPHVKGGRLHNIVDPRLRGRFDPAQLKNVVRVAMRCTDRNPEGRPTMAEVVEMLKCGGGEVVVVKDVEGEEDDDGDDDGTISEVGNSRGHGRSWTSSRMR